MNSGTPFKFIIKMPRVLMHRDASEQIFHVHAEYPHYYYSVILKPTEKMSTLEQQRLAIAELKVKLIKDISCAEFEFEKEDELLENKKYRETGI